MASEIVSRPGTCSQRKCAAAPSLPCFAESLPLAPNAASAVSTAGSNPEGGGRVAHAESAIASAHPTAASRERFGAIA